MKRGFDIDLPKVPPDLPKVKASKIHMPKVALPKMPNLEINLSQAKQLGSKKYKKRLLISLIILVAGLVGFFIYFYFFVANECKDVECYQEALLDCKKVWLIREGNTYVWRYEVLNKIDGNSCNVEVRLLRVNKGKLNVEDLQGKSMTCKVQKVNNVFPEKDMLRCNGLLKEEFQEIIIDRMHNYLLQNLGQIEEGLKEI